MGWGSGSTQNWFPYPHQTNIRYFNDTFISCGWSCESDITYYCNTCGLRLWKSAEIPWLFWAANDTIMQWPRLQTHPEWFPHSCQTCMWFFIIFICCGWQCWSNIKPLPQHLPTQIMIMEVRWNPVSLLSQKRHRYWSGWGSRPTQNASCIFYNHHGVLYKLHMHRMSI